MRPRFLLRRLSTHLKCLHLDLGTIPHHFEYLMRPVLQV